MSATIRKVLPTIAAVLFFVSTMSAALWDMEIGFRRSDEEFAGIYIREGNGEPGRAFDNNLHCRLHVAQGENSTIVASITNPGASADYEVTLWDEKSRYSASPGAKMCSTMVHIRRGETAEVTCDITAPRGNRLWRVVVWAVSSEDIAPHYFSRLPNSYAGICQIRIGSYTTDYLSFPLGAVTLGGVVVSAALWLLTRRRDRKLVNLTTCMAAVMGILVWILPFWYEILRLEADAPTWLAFAPELALIAGPLLFFISILRQ